MSRWLAGVVFADFHSPMKDLHPACSTLELPDARLSPTTNGSALKFVSYIQADLILHPEITEPIIELINVAFAVHACRFKGPRLEGHESFCGEISEEGTIFFTLYLGCGPAATGGIKPAAIPGACKLLLFATNPSSFRTGFGSLMLSHVESAAYQKGYRKMTMKTVKENDEIISFYSKRGYRVVSELRLPDDAGSWRECGSWAAKAPFTLCKLEKDIGGG
jgi:GNAT superfamily N-acetyltransferase